MPSLPIMLAPFALLLPLSMQFGDHRADAGDVGETTYHQANEGERKISPLPLSREAPAWSPLFDGIEPETGQQVRIDRRVILRISPAPAPERNRRNPNADAPQSPPVRIVERPMGDCIESAKVGGVADRGDYLLMFLRDRRTVAARLEKGCSPRDFYRGFYMERSEDGKICIRRDRLMSRSGAKCQVAQFRELVVEPVE